MSENKAEDLENLDTKIDSTLMKWLKRVAYVVTIIATITGGTLGVLSYVRNSQDPNTKLGYTEHSNVLQSHAEGIRDNRKEILKLYNTLLTKKHHKSDKTKKIRRIKLRQTKKWEQVKQ